MDHALASFFFLILSVELDNVFFFLCQGNLGTIDVIQKTYTTITRSHLSEIISLSFNAMKQQIATVSSDQTIKLWELDTFNQIYDFQSPTDKLSNIACHPTLPEFSAGFESGMIRIFSLATTSLKHEVDSHSAIVFNLVYNPSGKMLFSASQDGSLVQYDTSNSYNPIKISKDMVFKQASLPSYVIAVDSQGNRGALIGPSQYLVTVFSAKSLDEVC